MGQPAARVGDMHVCPMVTPGLPPIPHVGGPITGPGCPTVLIGGMPASVMGDMLVCVGPPDTVILGSTGVFFGGKPAARMGDSCAHGGTIVLGCPTVLVGETGSASTVGPVTAGTPAAASSVAASTAFKSAVSSLPPAPAVKAAQIAMMTDAAKDGVPLVHSPETCPRCHKKMQQS